VAPSALVTETSYLSGKRSTRPRDQVGGVGISAAATWKQRGHAATDHPSSTMVSGVRHVIRDSVCTVGLAHATLSGPIATVADALHERRGAPKAINESPREGGQQQGGTAAVGSTGSRRRRS